MLELANSPQKVDELIDSYMHLITNADQTSTSEVISQMISVGALVSSGDYVSPPSTKIGIRPLEETIPYLVLHVTFRCNLSCIYCYSNKFRNTMNTIEMNANQWKYVIDQAIDCGCKTIYITGGEPLLREDLFPVWLYAKQQGIYTKLLTNGTLITDSIAGKIRDSISELIISIDSNNAEINDLNRGKGTFHRLQQSFDILKNSEVSWQGEIVVNHNSMSTLEETFEWLKKLSGIHPVVTAVISTHNDDEESEEAFSYIDDQCIKNYDINAIWGDSLEYATRCGAGNSILSISPDGYVYPCKGLIADRFKGLNILNTELKESRDHSPNLVRFRNITYESIQICSDCKLIKFCMAGGCRALAYMRTGSIYGYIGDTICRVKRRRILGKIKQAVRNQ